MDIQQRVLVMNHLGRYCSEPSPDALAAFAAAVGIGAGTPTGQAVSAAIGGQSSAASVGLRTQSITLMRDALYRMCEAYANDAVGPAQIATLLGRSQDLTAVILAVEQLTGAVVANQAALTGTTSADASATALSTQKIFEQASANVERHQNRLDAAESNLATAKTERDQAQTNLQSAINNRDKINADPNATDEIKLEAQREVEFRQKERNRAQNALEAAQNIRDSRQAVLTSAQQTLDEIKSHQDSAITSAAAGTSSSSAFSGPGSTVKLSDESTKAIAESVERMVLVALNKDYTEDACVALMTHVPSDYDRWVDSKKVLYEKMREGCLTIIGDSVRARVNIINTKHENKPSSNRIDEWLKKDPQNRIDLNSWLRKNTNPRLPVSALLSGSFEQIRQQAIGHFGIP
jgi:hypothetical protein